MSDNIVESIIQVIRQLQHDLATAKQRIVELQEQTVNDQNHIGNLEQQIERLNRAIDDLEREKWSFQSELENLRGW